MQHEALRTAMADLVRGLQEDVCGELERLDGAGRFSTDRWERPGGGGGLARVLEGGALLERAGVNVAEVHGALDPAFAGALGGGGTDFAAVGLSVVLHPLSPMVPTAHMNVRLVARGEKAWFGGGADMTPYYLFEEDAAHFHRTLRAACDRHDPAWYHRFKKACDDYFFLPHRGEHRGVGGIFFEDPDPDLWRGLA
ncbi:MAG TPA: coproporphyrinogen III oxidase, partial [Anaeromyxobacteraceae bacterium]